ncbi:MAG TPA: Fic family protein [Steroidobacteraceae bacterium]|nr:Fic family protein [Steroidobacteraceae bacterium]
MATPAAKLAESLDVLKTLQDQGRIAIRARDLTRTHRQRLQAGGFIREVMKGWYFPSRPDDPEGESTSWYACYWNFCAAYLGERFGTGWCLSPEQSLSLHTGDWTVPKQLLVRSPRGNNKPTGLIFGTSILDVRLALPADQDIEIRDGVRIIDLATALISCAPSHFVAHPAALRAALAMVPDASDVLSGLLEGGHSKVAGRLAGAFRNIGRNQIADNIIGTMHSAGYTISESDPFEERSPIAFSPRETAPHVNRLRMTWTTMRENILKIFPAPPGLSADPAGYIKRVDEIYVADAYNSLSIEGYKVTNDLIERVRSGAWNPDAIKGDREHRHALAARGYWQAFQAVKQSIDQVLHRANAGTIADRDHATWYRELLRPSITAGILQASDLAGYRNGPVRIRRSMHVPARHEAVRELMPTFFALLQQENEPAVRVVMGHFAFVYIHPYFDGNGRMGRFVMNLMMASGGYPWTVVPLERRSEYMAALESASVEQAIEPLAKFLAELTAKASSP